jgi:hypothetical protein
MNKDEKKKGKNIFFNENYEKEKKTLYLFQISDNRKKLYTFSIFDKSP